MVKGHDGDIADLLRGDDALLDASKKGDLDRVKKLVTPENINCRDEHGRNSTPLHLAGTALPISDVGLMTCHRILLTMVDIQQTCNTVMVRVYELLVISDSISIKLDPFCM